VRLWLTRVGIVNQTVAGLLAAILDSIHTYVDYGDSVFDHVGSHGIRSADCGHWHIGLTGNCCLVQRVGVALAGIVLRIIIISRAAGLPTI
jgi:hypothetical protein